MDPCPSPECLERLLAGTLNGPEFATLAEHVAGCAQCEALLDRLADDPELRGWRPAESAAAETVDNGSGLARLVRRSPRPEGGLPFLEPPRRTGDLGSLGPYLVEAELGRGGMGVVLRAYDEGLQRTVALKVLRPDLAHAEARQRFVQEARAAARVRHDHVVTVFAVASPADGLPYFAMELLTGPSLAELIRSGPGLPPPRAAALVAQAADGLAAAHAAGLVHRDVKPANVLLDPATERVKVSDFGLACRQEAQPGADRLTQHGALLGTPAYMSPEQAQGSATVDARTDVYGLGATLYEALTGELPFRGAAHLVLRQVVSEEPRSPRQLNDGVPRDLETICLKAMAKEPHRRYQSAAELAADLRRWLNGEPIQARPAGRLEKGWRWCRRNPRVAWLAAALTLTLLVGFALVTWQWLRADANATDALDKAIEAERERGKAEANFGRAEQSFRHAHEAVNRFLLEVGALKIVRAPGMDAVRRKLLREALDYYREFLKQRANDPTLTSELAIAHGQLGNIQHALGEHKAALAAYEKAAALLEPLVRAHPAALSYAQELARIHEYWGSLQTDLGQRAAAQRHLQQALELIEPVARDRGADARVRYLLVFLHGDIGLLHQHAERLDEAQAHFRKAIDLARELPRDGPNSYSFQVILGKAYNGLASVCQDREQVKEALAACEAGRTVCENLSAAYPHHAGAQANLAANCFRRGGLYATTGRPEEAQRLLEEARALQTAVTRADPHVLQNRLELAAIHGSLGLAYSMTDKLTEALASLEEARALFQKLADAHPTLVAVQVGLVHCLNDLGNVQQRKGQPSKALHSYQQAIAVGEKVMAANRAVVRTHSSLGIVYNNLGLLQAETGALQDAMKTLGKARALQERLTEAYPDVPAYRDRLAGSLTNLGSWQVQLGQTEAGLKLLRAAAALREKLIQTHPAVAEYRYLLATTCYNLGTRCSLAARTLGKRELLEEAHRCHDRARSLAEQLVRAQPGHARYLCVLAVSHQHLAELEGLRGRLDDALRLLDRARALGADLVRNHPTVSDYRDRLARMHFLAGKIHVARKEFEAALSAYGQAQSLQEIAVKSQPDNAAHQVALAETYRFSGGVLRALARRDLAATAFRNALTHLAPVCDKAPQVLLYRQVLSLTYRQLSRVLWELDRPADLATLAHRRRQRWPADPHELFFSARDLARCAGLVGKGKADLAAAEQKERDRYADEVLVALREAVRHGFRDPGLLATGPEFALLRDRDDFKKLQAELAVKAKGSPK